MDSMEWIPLKFNIRSSKGESKLTSSDFNTLKYVDVVLDKLKDAKKIVVHCHAGLHRSGFFVFILLRRHGMSFTSAIEAVRLTRRLTFEEMMYTCKNRLSLAQTFEHVFEGLCFGPCGLL